MKFLNIILWISLFTFIALPSVQGVMILVDQETMLSGDEGETVTYTVRIQNDDIYPVDIQLHNEVSDWEITIHDFERLGVQPGDIEEFRVDVTIPLDSENQQCTSRLRFYQKASYIGINDYEENLPHELITSINPEEETNMFQLILYSSISLFFVCSFSYLWYGRKYFFITPFYTHISKEKLLDHKNRELISNFLSENSGASLSEISNGTGIHLQTLRHHIKLFEQSNLVLRKENRYFIKKPGSDIIDTDILSPILQKLIEIIETSDGISMAQLANEANRSKPWIGNRIHDLLVLNLIEIVSVGRYKYIYLKGQGPVDMGYSANSSHQSLAG